MFLFIWEYIADSRPVKIHFIQFWKEKKTFMDDLLSTKIRKVQVEIMDF